MSAGCNIASSISRMRPLIFHPYCSPERVLKITPSSLSFFLPGAKNGSQDGDDGGGPVAVMWPHLLKKASFLFVKKKRKRREGSLVSE